MKFCSEAYSSLTNPRKWIEKNSGKIEGKVGDFFFFLVCLIFLIYIILYYLF